MEIIKARQFLKPNKIIIFYHQSWSPAFEQDKELFGQVKELLGQDNTLAQTRLPCLNLMSLKISFPLFVHVFTTKCTESRGPSFRILTWTVFHTELSWTDDSFVEYEKQFVLNFILPSPTASCLRDCILETRGGVSTGYSNTYKGWKGMELTCLSLPSFMEIHDHFASGSFRGFSNCKMFSVSDVS